MFSLTRVSAVAAAVLGIAAASAAAAPTPRYVAIDVGTLGGPNAYPNAPGRPVSENGTVVGSAETPAINPFTQECDGCHVLDAFQWRDGVISDLGTLGGYSAGLFEINASGHGVGFSETGVLDPRTVFPEVHAVTSSNGHLTDLGTLGGNESWASGINNRGQYAGFATNTLIDPNAGAVAQLGLAPYPSATEWRAVLWGGGGIRDLGTLGGTDSFGGLLNERGQASGESFTNSTANASTGLPTLDPFIWENGVMRDLGSLGGTLGFASWMNSSGEVAGASDLAGDQTIHPFLWTGKRLVDLGTLGGDFGLAGWVSDTGQVTGLAATVGDQAYHGFLWNEGQMTDLPPVAGEPCSAGNFVGSGGTVVGSAQDCSGAEHDAVLWQNGKAFDLNDLIGSSELHLYTAEYMNKLGEIFADATLPNGDNRVVLLVPAALAAAEGLHASRELASARDMPTATRDHRSPNRAGFAQAGLCQPARMAAYTRLPIAVSGLLPRCRRGAR